MALTEIVFNALENVVAPLRSSNSLCDEARNLRHYAKTLEEEYGEQRREEVLRLRHRAHDLTGLGNFPPFPFPLWTARWVILASERRHPTATNVYSQGSPFDRIKSRS